MKIKIEKGIPVSSPMVTKLLLRLFENGANELSKANKPNLADYSTKFKDIR